MGLSSSKPSVKPGKSFLSKISQILSAIKRGENLIQDLERFNQILQDPKFKLSLLADFSELNCLIEIISGSSDLKVKEILSQIFLMLLIRQDRCEFAVTNIFCCK
jgi:hypothetical protein